MIVLDVNVLLPLLRTDHAGHELTAAWWAREVSGPGRPVTVVDLVWVGLMRIVTSPRTFVEPSTIEEACDFMNDVLAQSFYRPFVPDQRFLSLFGRECIASRATENLVTDAYIASAARSLGAEVATFDRDFRRFDDLRVLTPS